jgi:hypothetical protein
MGTDPGFGFKGVVWFGTVTELAEAVGFEADT